MFPLTGVYRLFTPRPILNIYPLFLPSLFGSIICINTRFSLVWHFYSFFKGNKYLAFVLIQSKTPKNIIYLFLRHHVTHLFYYKSLRIHSNRPGFIATLRQDITLTYWPYNSTFCVALGEDMISYGNPKPSIS